MLTEEGLRSFEKTMGLDPDTLNQPHPLRGILEDMYSNYIEGLAPANVSLYDQVLILQIFCFFSFLFLTLFFFFFFFFFF